MLVLGKAWSTSLVPVRVIHTDEELMVARSVGLVLSLGRTGETDTPDHTLSAEPQQRTARGWLKERTLIMLSKAKMLTGYKLQSLDGEIGRVIDFYFDDRDWMIRYLVADTGEWLVGSPLLKCWGRAAAGWPTPALPMRWPHR